MPCIRDADVNDCWTVLLPVQTNRQDIKPVMVAWLVVSIFTGFLYAAALGLAVWLSVLLPESIPIAVASLAGLAAGVVGMIDFGYWQRNKRTKSTR